MPPEDLLSPYPPAGPGLTVETAVRLPPEQISPFLPGNPIDHAFALYDQDRYPDRVRFHALREGSRLVAYLLVWLGDPAVPEVHWLGAPVANDLLARALPPRPFVLNAPREVAPLVERHRGPTQTYPLEALLRPASLPLGPPRGPPVEVREVHPEERETLRTLPVWDSHLPPEPLTGPAPPGGPRLVGAFLPGPRRAPVAVARTLVELPGLWVLGGIFTDPEHRGRGFGQAVTRTLIEAAQARGADSALYVRADNVAARALYADLGFQPHHPLLWMDAGSGQVP
jgi:GNAT superfamily N-acetyltransferase